MAASGESFVYASKVNVPAGVHLSHLDVNVREVSLTWLLEYGQESHSRSDLLHDPPYLPLNLLLRLLFPLPRLPPLSLAVCSIRCVLVICVNVKLPSLKRLVGLYGFDGEDKAGDS